LVLLTVACATTFVFLYPPRTGAGPVDAGTKTLKAPTQVEVQDEIVNSYGMRLKLIKPGTFLMGSPTGEEGKEADEQPQHLVQITRPFYLGVYPVTQTEYVQVTGQKNPSWFSNEGGGKSKVEGLDTSRFPVENVSWNEAVAFCETLNRLDGNKPAGWKYALPTEAEWEYACRTKTTTAYFFGRDANDLGNYAWYGVNAEGRTHTVGTRLPNPCGLCDINGNVYQWCDDWYNYYYYTRSPQKDPQNSEDSGGIRALRGGSWYDIAEHCRSARRLPIAPEWRQNVYGFRVCVRPA
jgi:formylglycine-generating enzyme required for sulfatase activity